MFFLIDLLGIYNVPLEVALKKQSLEFELIEFKKELGF
jgi:hypothetical protein